MSEPSQKSNPLVSEEEHASQRRSERLVDRAAAAAAKAKYPSVSSVHNSPVNPLVPSVPNKEKSVRPRRSVRNPSLVEPLPSGPVTKTQVVRCQVRRTPVPQSKQSRGNPAEESRSEQPQFEPSASTSESSASEAPAQRYKEEAPVEEEELAGPSTSRSVSSDVTPDCLSKKFDEPEEEVSFKWSPLSPIPENNPCLDCKVKLYSEGSDQFFEEETSSSCSSENFERRMAQPNYIQTIPITANIQPFRGLRAKGELHFQPGSDVRSWLDSVEAYFAAAGITQDAKKIANISTLVDRSCGDAAAVVARIASEFISQIWAALRKALISHYSDFKISDPLTQMKHFMNTKAPIKNIQQLPMLLLKTREKVDSLVDAYISLPAFSQTPAAQIPELKKTLKRFAFIMITGAWCIDSPQSR